MPSSFDPTKDAANRKKHGVSLSEGDGVLNDPLALTIEDTSAQGEQRLILNWNECAWKSPRGGLHVARRRGSNHFCAQSRTEGNQGL